MAYTIAGIDVHKRMLAVVVSELAADAEDAFERRPFGSTPAQLRLLAAWLSERQVDEVVMESTAQYWRPVWAALERHPPKGSDYVQRKRDEPLMVDVRQLAFRLHPDELIAIEFRRVARQAVGLHPGMAAEKSLDVPTPMDFPAVPQQNNLVSEMTEQLAEKRSRTSRRVLGGGRPQIAQTR